MRIRRKDTACYMLHIHMKLLVRIIPNAKQSEAVGWEGQTLKVRIAAPPIEGKANAALVRFMAELCGCAPSEIEITKGLTGKQKTLDVPCLPRV
jgi:uncharacterized protein (TIGR00251 family)